MSAWCHLGTALVYVVGADKPLLRYVFVFTAHAKKAPLVSYKCHGCNILIQFCTKQFIMIPTRLFQKCNSIFTSRLN